MPDGTNDIFLAQNAEQLQALLNQAQVNENKLGGTGGNADLPEFSASDDYAAGQYVFKDGYVYRFTAAHPAGAWTGTDAVQTSVFGEMAYFSMGNIEAALAAIVGD